MVANAIILWAVLAATAVFWIYALLIETRRLVVRQIAVPLPNLPAALAGLRIAHLSDPHCSDRATAESVIHRAVMETLRQGPDLVLITGDLARGSKCANAATEQLRELSAPHGVYTVLGNHDWDCTLGSYLFGSPGPRMSLADWRQALAGTGIQLLANESRTIIVNGQTIAIVGIGDPSCGRDDLETALAHIGPADLKILLAHSPDAIDLPQAPWADLLLAGHTHGGQWRLPGLGTLWAPVWRLRRRSAGLMRFGQSIVHVSCGLAAGTDARFLCPPEISILTLVPGGAEQIPVTPRLPAETRCCATTTEVNEYAALE